MNTSAQESHHFPTPTRHPTGPASSWLEAFCDKNANIHTLSSCICLADCDDNGTFDLVLVDYPRKVSLWEGGGLHISNHKFFGKRVNHVVAKLNTYRDTSLFTSVGLPSYPSSVDFLYYTPAGSTRCKSALAVACDDGQIFIYHKRNPDLQINLDYLSDGDSLDLDIWQRAEMEIIQTLDDLAVARDPTSEVGASVLLAVAQSMEQSLLALRESGCSELSRRSLQFLRLDKTQERVNFLRTEKAWKTSMMTPQITCMKVLKKSQSSDYSNSCIVVGLEEKLVYVLIPPEFLPSDKFQLSTSPMLLSVWGLYDGEYKMAVACRDSSVYVLSGNECRHLTYSKSPLVGLISFKTSLMMANMDKDITEYTWEGERLFNLKMPSNIVCMELFEHQQKNFFGYIVGLANNEIRIYKKQHLYSIVQTESIPVAMKFGPYGRESHCLLYICEDGSLNLKMLKRSIPLTEPLPSGEESLVVAPESGIPTTQPAADIPRVSIPLLSKQHFMGTEIERSCMKQSLHYQRYIKIMRTLQPSTPIQTTEQSILPLPTFSSSCKTHDDKTKLKLTADLEGSYSTGFRLTMHVKNVSSDTLYDVILSCIPIQGQSFHVFKHFTQIPFLLSQQHIVRYFEIRLANGQSVNDPVQSNRDSLCRQVIVSAFDTPQDVYGTHQSLVVTLPPLD